MIELIQAPILNYDKATMPSIKHSSGETFQWWNKMKRSHFTKPVWSETKTSKKAIPSKRPKQIIHSSLSIVLRNEKTCSDLTFSKHHNEGKMFWSTLSSHKSMPMFQRQSIFLSEQALKHKTFKNAFHAKQQQASVLTWVICN